MSARLLRGLAFALLTCGCGLGAFEIAEAPELEQAGLVGGGSCGDGTNNASEQCDDHNTFNGDGCSSLCTVEPGWTCPPTGPSQGQCVPCGDGVATVPPEGCDDGNTVNGDGCSSTCTLEAGWTCQSPPNGPSVCTGCGDGIVQANEACDDGPFNGQPGACNATCQVMLPWQIVAQTQPATLTLAPAGTVGVFASSTNEVCDEGD